MNDLGHVQCSGVPLTVIPEAINQSYVYTLSFQRNGLRSIEPRSFWGTGLKGIEISDNFLTSLDVDSFYGLENSLRELNLRNNRLMSIPTEALNRLARLQILNLNHNQINELSVESGSDFPSNLNVSLRVLLLANNGLNIISQYAFRNCKSLELLDLSGNNIHIINQVAFNFRPFSGNSGSTRIIRQTDSISSSQSHSRPIRNVHSTIGLKTLYLAGNRLTRIPFELITNLSQLQVLDLSDNLIVSTHDPIVIDRALTMDELNLAGNNIQSLSENSFRNFAYINRLKISQNPLKSIDHGAFVGTIIHSIDLDECELVNISSGAWNDLDAHLYSLSLSGNFIRSDPRIGQIFYNDSFNKLEVLQRLRLNGNSEPFRLSPLSLAASQESLSEIEITGPPNSMRTPFTPIRYQLQFMNVRRFALSRTLYDRRLTHQDLLGYGGYNLEEVDLSSSYIEDISWDTFTSSPSLKHLNLSHNNLRRLDVQVFRPIARTLTVLDLNDALATSVLDCDVFTYLLTSLRKLIISDNGITTLSSPTACFAASEHLTHLSLEFNSLRSIDQHLFQHLSSLVYLLLAYNRLTILDSDTFKMMDKLSYIDLSYNSIRIVKSGAFNELNVLTEINLEGNNIELLEPDSFVILPRLQRINLAQNRLKAMQLAAFDQIGAMTTMSLEMAGNMINLDTRASSVTGNLADDASDDSPPTTINQNRNSFTMRITGGGGGISSVGRTAAGLTMSMPSPPSSSANSVEICDLSNNNISHLNSSYFLPFRNTLTHLILDDNHLSRIGFQSISGLPALQKLSIRRNGLNSLASDAFRSEFSLQMLDLSHNSLIELPSELFRDNGALRYLNLAFNKLPVLPDSLLLRTPKMEIIDLSYNQISLFPSKTLRNISNSLRILRIAGNSLWSIRKEDFDGLFPRLLLLDLSHNNIKQIQSNVFTSMVQLKSLDLSNNPMKILREAVLIGLHDSLEELNLHGCKLSNDLPNWSTFEKLNYLNISNNMLTSLNFYNFTRLTTLDMARNRFTTLPNNIWHFLPSLQRLDISNNMINTLHNDSLIGLRRLQHLNIQNLSLSYLQYGALKPLSSLEVLHVSNYPSIRDFSISRLISDNLAIQEINIHVINSSVAYQSLLTDSRASLPKGLNKITLTGTTIRQLDELFFSHIENQELELIIHHTNISQLTPVLFSSLGKTRILSLDIRHNMIQKVSDVLLAVPQFSRVSRCLNDHHLNT